MKSVFVTVIADLSRLPADHFWNMMDFHGWTHPYDAKGRRRAVFRTAEDDQDDGGRSLSLARPANCAAMGGFAKDSTPFSEFLWADFLRPRIKAKAIKADFDAALTKALDPGEDRAKPTTCPAGADRTPTPSARSGKAKASKRQGKEPPAPLRPLRRPADGLDRVSQRSSLYPASNRRRA